MLKRQRPISPPPSSAIPIVSDPPESHRREIKRRRVLPPSLDGQSRRPTFHTEDDGEEDDDDDDDVDMSGQYNQPDSTTVTSAVHNTQYESANTFLHDLHALHRHRLIFSSPSSTLLQPGLSPPRTQDKSHPPPIADYPRIPDKQDSSGMHDFGRGFVEEVESVKERYEDTNRRLGSLFLTRRKQLDPGPHQYNT
ncbi:hypothetical protein DFH08DRAFT_475047 [Mycena albidolilacea]|uniref:Uncharacterized protein n=1 Tax=Mycena albidolilacea TaxID=1033008 RepID=A0AAD7AFZ5_9AGAR|nr:hypothetical protein DFH08DRAFT_475047 [Mycena albidolilacea]